MNKTSVWPTKASPDDDNSRFRFWKQLTLTILAVSLITTRLENTPSASLQRGETPHPPNECHGYDIKQSDGEAPVMLELWGKQSTLSLPLLPDPLRFKVVASDRVLSMG